MNSQALALLIVLAHPLSSSANAQTFFVTDSEGRKDNLFRLVQEGKLKLKNESGREFLDFTDSSSALLFGGDLPDRGPDSIKLVDWLTDLKTRHPNRVTLILGNRDGNKLDYVEKLPSLKTLQNSEYRQWLESRLKDQDVVPSEGTDQEVALKQNNTALNRLTWWLDKMGNPKGLDWHQTELSELRGDPVSLDDAANDYETWLSNQFMSFLKLSQIGATQSNVLAVHGGISDDALHSDGFIVPGDSKQYSSAQDWLRNLNLWGTLEIEKARAGQGSKIPVYADAVMFGDSSGGHFADGQHQSVVYPLRDVEGGNPRLPSKKVIDQLRKSGIDTLLLGHTPMPGIPIILKGEDFLVVMGDTSFAEDRGGAFISVDNGTVRVKTSVDGKDISYSVSAQSSGPIGKLYDGYLIAGQAQDGSYLAVRYGENFKIERRWISENSLDSTKVQTPHYVAKDSTARIQESLIQSLSRRDQLRTLEQIDRELQGRVPVGIAGGSKYGVENDDKTGDHIRAEAQAFLKATNPEKIAFVTGATANGVEKIWMEEIKAKNQALKQSGRPPIPLFGITSQEANAAEIGSEVDGVFIAQQGWDGALEAQMKFVQSHGGFFIFTAGGGVIKRGISKAKELNLSYALTEGVGFSSEELAKLQPERAYRGPEGLIARAKESVQSILKSAEVAASPHTFKTADTGEVIEFFRAKGKDVVTFVGYSGAGYENPAMMLEHARRELSKLNPKTTVINAGGTSEGIGAIYSLAKEMGFETSGIVSIHGREYLKDRPANVDHLFFVNDSSWGGYKPNSLELSETSEAIIGVSDKVIGIGGGDIARDELTEAQKRGIEVTFYPADMNHNLAIEKAAKTGKPPPFDFRGSAHTGYAMQSDVCTKVTALFVGLE